MNLEYFIAQRLITSKKYKSSISAPIIKIAISAIAIGMVMMIVSIATGIGLQEKIREKLAAFSGHIIITNFDDNQSKVSTKPISTNQKFYPKFQDLDSTIARGLLVAHQRNHCRPISVIKGKSSTIRLGSSTVQVPRPAKRLQ